MKTLLSVLALVFTSVCFAQTVTINTTGNRNKQIVVDNQTYTINNTTASATQAVVVSNLAAGQHTLSIVRNNQNKNTSSNTSFTVRQGYDLTISVSANGSVSTSEKRIAGIRGGGARGQMTTAAYTTLYNQTKAKITSTQRAAYLETELSNTNKKLTASQASELIKLVNSESLRLDLAKQSYAKVSDQQNFSLVSNLLVSSSSRTELSRYIGTVSEDDNTTVINKVAMTDTDFKAMYRKVQLTWGLGGKYSSLTEIFNTETNYFTVAQAKQLIQLVSSESNRLELAKASYNNITDPANFSQMYDVLSSQSNKNALAAYVNSNAYNN